MKLRTAASLILLCAGVASVGAHAQTAAAPSKPDAAAIKHPTAAHRDNAENRLPNGWHLARSTDGAFSVEMPGPFRDFTVTQNVTMHMLISSDAAGATYEALLMRVTESGMTAKFERELLAAGSAATTFRGFPALIEERPMSSDETSSSLRFVTPAGLHFFNIVSKVKDLGQRTAQRERYFNSIVLE